MFYKVLDKIKVKILLSEYLYGAIDHLVIDILYYCCLSTVTSNLNNPVSIPNMISK